MSTLPGHEPDHHEPTCHAPDDEAAVDLVIEARPRGVGTMTVARLLPVARRRQVGPFVFLDHMGPVELPPGVGFDVLPHPHIGLSTLTYFLAGENVHRDSLGTVQVNRPGDVNLMTAGRGVVHSERADPAWRARGGTLHGVQIWLALPDEHEDDEPSFQHHPQATLPAVSPAPGARGRVLAGAAFGAASPLRHPGRPLLVDLELEPGAALDVPDAPERGVFVIEGEVRLGGRVLGRDRLAVLAPGARACVAAVTPSRLLVLGGPPLGPRVMDWNFVASSTERLVRARDAWKAQQFPKIPTDADEYVPYPELHR